MILFDDIPRDPPSAFRHILTTVQNKISAMPQNHKFTVPEQTELTTLFRMLQKTANRLENGEDYEKVLVACIASVSSKVAETLRTHLISLENLFIAQTFDSHFIDEEDEADFNTVNWQGSDRSEVIDILNKARQFVLYSVEFEDKHKRQIKYWIDMAEAQVLTAPVKLSHILGAVDQIAEAAAAAGKKALPLGDFVKSIRTTTKRNVHIHQIEAPEEQKKLPKPDSD